MSSLLTGGGSLILRSPVALVAVALLLFLGGISFSQHRVGSAVAVQLQGQQVKIEQTLRAHFAQQEAAILETVSLHAAQGKGGRDAPAAPAGAPSAGAPSMDTAVAKREPTTGAWSVDAMRANFRRSAAMQPRFYPELGRALKPAKCTPPDQPFFMHENGRENSSLDWVCDDEVERRITRVMEFVFKEGCPRNALMLDVGANTGFFGLLAMRMGCEALFFDLQPQCQTLVNSALFLNGFGAKGRVLPYGVAASQSTLQVGTAGCDGRFPASAHEQGTFNHPKGKSVEVELQPLHYFVNSAQPVLLMKVDTEGSEARVLEGAMEFFRQRLVRNAVIEVTPCCNFWKHVGMAQHEVAEAFQQVAAYGYKMVALDDWTVHRTPEEVFRYISTLPAERSGVPMQTNVWLVLDLPVGSGLPLRLG